MFANEITDAHPFYTNDDNHPVHGEVERFKRFSFNWIEMEFVISRSILLTHPDPASVNESIFDVNRVTVETQRKQIRVYCAVC